jgi:flagellar basal body-associated protein FliL
MKNFMKHFFIQFVSIRASLANVGAVLLVVKPRLGGGHGRAAEAAVVKEVPVTVPLEEFTVNLADANGEHYLKITVVLQVPGKEAAKKVEEFKPAIRDAIISTLTRQYYPALQSSRGKVQLKQQLKEETDAVLHDAGITVVGVLFTQFVMQ